MDNKKKDFTTLVQKIVQDGTIDNHEIMEFHNWLAKLEPLPTVAEQVSLKRVIVKSVIKGLKKNRLNIDPADAVSCVDEIIDVLFSFFSSPEEASPKPADESQTEVHFSGPGHLNNNLWPKIEETLEETKNSVDIAAFNMTYKPLKKLLQKLAIKSKVTIRIFAEDASAASVGSILQELNKTSNITVKVDIPVILMHNKFMIIDQKMVINGSMNFTRTGIHQNYENIMITSHPEVTPFFVQEFEQLWDSGTELKKTTAVD